MCCQTGFLSLRCLCSEYVFLPLLRCALLRCSVLRDSSPLSIVLFWEACVCLIVALCLYCKVVLRFIRCLVLCFGHASPLLLATALYSFALPCWFETDRWYVVSGCGGDCGGGSDQLEGGSCYSVLRGCFCETEATNLALLIIRFLRKLRSFSLWLTWWQ